MDQFDRATEREEQMRADALEAQARRAGLAGKTAADSATHCEDCGGEIPEPRRLALPGVRLCVECQEYCEMTARKGTRC